MSAPLPPEVVKSVVDAADAQLSAKFATTEDVNRKLQALVDENTKLRADLTKSLAEIKVGDPNIISDNNRGFKHEGEFYKAVWDAAMPGAKVDERLKSAPSGMNLSSGPDGGYAFPPAFSTSIMDKVIADSDDLSNLVDQVKVDGVESLTLLAVNETSRANGSRWGGIQGYWKPEVQQMTSSKPTLREIKIEPQELYVFGYVTDKALRNSPVALANYFNRAAVDEIKFKTGDAIVNGTGVGQPMGMLGSTCKITAAALSGQATATINEANVAAMWKRLPASARNRAVWLANQDIQDQLDLLVSVVKNVAGTENVGGINTRLYNPETGRLKNRPVLFTEYNQTLGTEGDLMLIDPLGYVLGRRGTLNQAQSMHLRFDYAETALRLITEVDGQAYLKSAITPFKGSTTVSTIVTLATR